MGHDRSLKKARWVVSIAGLASWQVRSCRCINDTGPPSYRSPDMCITLLDERDSARAGSLPYGFPGFLRFSRKGPHKGSLNIQSLRGRSFTTALSQNKLLSLRGALQQHPPKSQSSLFRLSHSPYISPNHPLMFCPFAAPVGFGSLDLLSLCRPRRSRHIPSLAPWAPMSGYTLYVSRCAVVTGSEVNEITLLMRLVVTPRTQFRNSFSAIKEKSGILAMFVGKGSVVIRGK
ncbi:uncharacterized protein TNCV_1391821 [Trichonephila clavipes]|nr:uncharacterized protein TNCV_1391821 [Trichonephila clavipes]